MERSRLVTIIAMLFVMASCQKPIEGLNKPEEKNKKQPGFICGMEEAMSRMSPEARQQLMQSASKTATQVPELMIYLDFDGAIILPGSSGYTGGSGSASIYRSSIINNTRFCPVPALTAAQIAEIVSLVADDYSPFNIRVTTSLNEFLAYPFPNQRHVNIITTLPFVLGLGSSVGGIAPYAGPGTRFPNQPSFTFSSLYSLDLKYIASTISHEVGHTISLNHQPEISPKPENPCFMQFEYNFGYGTGALGFAPIMGYGGLRVGNWFAQSCGTNQIPIAQDDYALINSQVAVRPDDFPNTAGAGAITTATQITGVLGGDDPQAAPDVDFIKFNLRNPGPLSFSVTSENIDIKASLYQGGHLIGEYNDPDDTHVQASVPFAAGMMFLKIEGASNANMERRFMTGQYKVTLNY